MTWDRGCLIVGSVLWGYLLLFFLLAYFNRGSMPRRVPTHRSGPSKQAVTRMYDKTPQRREDHSFYCSKPWLTTRREKLSMNPLCEVCLKANRYVPATDVHHVFERKDHPELALDLDNLESLCKSCHGTMRRGQKRS